MSQYIKAARTADVPVGGSLLVQPEGKKVVLFNLAGEFFALDNSCPHNNGPICEGRIDGDTVICPYHHWEFDIRTGKSKALSAYKIKMYNLKLDGDEIYVEV
ncbi:MAG: Rieske 2Fe-2S domain-containing protein [Nitrospirae bacterium]|nr:Rieske 2Fe-2S domain-containing protein [Nitrospirota bacterium]